MQGVMVTRLDVLDCGMMGLYLLGWSAFKKHVIFYYWCSGTTVGLNYPGSANQIKNKSTTFILIFFMKFVMGYYTKLKTTLEDVYHTCLLRSAIGLTVKYSHIM